MKRTILRVLFGVAAFDFVLGLVLVIAASGQDSRTAWRNACLLLLVGAVGSLWFGRALQREPAKVPAS